MTDTPMLQHAEDAEQAEDQPANEAEFTIYVDGGGGPDPAPFAVAAVVVDRRGELVIEHAKEIGKGTVNEAEYKALLLGISMAHLVGARVPHFVSDSQLIVQQVGGWWAITEKNPNLAELHRVASSRLMEFDEFSIQHIGREKNKRADWLVSKLLGHSRTLKKAPTVGIQFRTGKTRPGWAGVPYKNGGDRRTWAGHGLGAL